jgi:hypothetical protein
MQRRFGGFSGCFDEDFMIKKRCVRNLGFIVLKIRRSLSQRRRKSEKKGNFVQFYFGTVFAIYIRVEKSNLEFFYFQVTGKCRDFPKSGRGKSFK